MNQLTSIARAAGTTWKIVERFVGYSPSEYELTLYLRLNDDDGAVADSATISFDADGDAFKATYDASGLAGGEYQYAYRATDASGDTFTVESGRVRVLPDIATATDGRTYWEAIYHATSKAIREIAEVGYSEMNVEGRSVKYDSTWLDYLSKLRARAESEMRAETKNATSRKRRTIKLIFSDE